MFSALLRLVHEPSTAMFAVDENAKIRDTKRDRLGKIKARSHQMISLIAPIAVIVADYCPPSLVAVCCLSVNRRA